MAISSQPARELGIQPVPQGAAATERQMMVYWRKKAVRYRFLLAPFVLYAPPALAFCLWTWSERTLARAMVPLLLVLGVVCWTLMEYLLHRFLLHLHVQSPTLQSVIEKLHLGHHRDPTDEAIMTVPVFASLPIAMALLGLFRLLAGSWEGSGLLMAGTIAGYLAYEAVHFRIHCGSKPGRVLSFQRAAHFFHHYKDPTRCFGVTSPLWDWICGTRRSKLTARV